MTDDDRLYADDHRHYADWAAAYALGALDARDRRAYESHLARCPICTTTVAEFAPIPALIAKVDPAELGYQLRSGPGPGRAGSDAIAGSARRQVAAMNRANRRWRLATAVSAVAAVVLGLMLLWPSGNGGSEQPELLTATVVSSAAAETNVSVIPRGWGTEIVLNIDGLPQRPSYQLWAVDESGLWVSAATWSPTARGTVRLTGASSLPVEQLERVLITSFDREDVLVEAAP